MALNGLCLLMSLKTLIYSFIESKTIQFTIAIGVTCPFPSPPENGAISHKGNGFGDVITYSCKRGYNLNGIATRRCQADGSWSGTPPSCESEYDKAQILLLLKREMLFLHVLLLMKMNLNLPILLVRQTHISDTSSNY